MIRKLAHLNFVTNNLEKIIDFYVNKLGLKVKFTLDNKEGKPFGYYFACGDTTFLEFFDQAMAAQMWGGKVEELNIGTLRQTFLPGSHSPGRVLPIAERERCERFSDHTRHG